MCMTSAHGTTNGSAYAIWWAMLCGTSTQTDPGCTRCPIFMRSLRSQPLSSALRLRNNTREQHECTNLMHSDLERQPVAFLGRQAAALLAHARAQLAVYLGVAADDVVYVPNPTTAINMIARSLHLRPTDEILRTDHEYGAMEWTRRFVCHQTGAQYVRQPLSLPVTDA